MSVNYLDNPISERHRLLRETGDINYIYILLQKHLRKSIEELKNIYSIRYSIVTDDLVISGSYENMYSLFLYFSRFGLQFLKITPSELHIKGNHFLTIIY